MFAVYAGLDKKNIEKAKEIILQQFRRLEGISKKDFDEAKTFIEGSYTLDTEDNLKHADELAVWESIEKAELAKSYLKNIGKVRIDDVKRIAKKYLNSKYTLVVIEQK